LSHTRTFFSFLSVSWAFLFVQKLNGVLQRQITSSSLYPCEPKNYVIGDVELAEELVLADTWGFVLVKKEILNFISLASFKKFLGSHILWTYIY
jgi:hypothetical protein